MPSTTDACIVLSEDGPQTYVNAYQELKVMFFFSGLPFDSIRAEFEDEDIDPAMGFSATKLMNTMPWVDGSRQASPPLEGQDKVIFVDASDVVFGDIEEIVEDENEWLSPVAFGVEVFREFIYKKIFQNIKGHVTIMLCAYSPAEPLMFAMADIFGDVRDDEGLYSSFRALSSSKFLNTFADLEIHGWSFDVSHCCIFEGYELVMEKYGLDDRIQQAEMALAILRGQEAANLKRRMEKQGNVNGLPLYMEDIDVDNVHELSEEEWTYNGYGVTHTANGFPRWTINFEGKQYNTKEMTAEVERLKQEKTEAEEKAQEEWDDKSWDEQQQDILARADYLETQEKERWNRLQQELKEIDRLIKESDQKNFKYDNNLDNQVAVAIWNSQTNKGQNTDFYDLSGRHFGKVPFKGKWWSNSELRSLKSQYQKEHAAKMKEADDTRHEGEIYKKRKWIAVGHIILAVGSIVITPLSLLDIALEVYECDVTGEKLYDANHTANIMLDFVGLIPIVGGGIKLGKLLKTGKAIVSAARETGKAIVKEGVKTVIKKGTDDILEAVVNKLPGEVGKAREFLQGVKNGSKLTEQSTKALSEAEGAANKLESAEAAAVKAEGLKPTVANAKADSNVLKEQATKRRGEATHMRESATNSRTQATEARQSANQANDAYKTAEGKAKDARGKAENAKNNIPKEDPSTTELIEWKNSQGKKKYPSDKKLDPKTENRWRREYNQERGKRQGEATRLDREASRLEGEAATAKTNASELDNLAKGSEAKATTLEENAFRLEDEALQLENQVTKREAKVQRLEEQMSGFQEEAGKIDSLKADLDSKMKTLGEQLTEDFYKSEHNFNPNMGLSAKGLSSILGNMWRQGHIYNYYSLGWGKGSLEALKDFGSALPGFGARGDYRWAMELGARSQYAYAWAIAQNFVVKPYFTFGVISNYGFAFENTKNPNEVEVPEQDRYIDNSAFYYGDDANQCSIPSDDLKDIHNRGMMKSFGITDFPMSRDDNICSYSSIDDTDYNLPNDFDLPDTQE